MRQHTEFNPVRSILVPFVHNGAGTQALEAARHLDAHIIVVGIAVVSPDQSLSLGAAFARDLRKQFRRYGKDPQITCRAHILVSHNPWNEFARLIQTEAPDLLMLEFENHPGSLGVTINEILGNPPCNIALVNGKLPNSPRQILVPVRGGPHAELALRVGLGLHGKGVTALHLRRPNSPEPDAPFKGLERVLKQLPEVKKEYPVTDDPVSVILENAKKSDVIILGTTAQPLDSPVSLGPMADRILREAPCPVIAVKSARPLPLSSYDETAGVQAISILVDKWFAENTFHADEFKRLDELVALKKAQGVTISLALPALNEEKTVGRVIGMMKQELMEKFPLLDEIVLIDSNSQDRTREIAAEAGVPVHIHQRLLPRLGARRGKGEALWKSLLVTQGDIVAWIDTDIVNIHPRFVYGIIGPMLTNPDLHFVKGFYRRPLRIGEKLQATGGGRVTELAARPLFNLFYPELSGIIQPLSGEYAGRRAVLERATFFSGYGVETGLLIDIYENYGIGAIAQVDLLERIHKNQSLEALSKMSFAIIQTVVRKLEKRFGRAVLEDVNRSMKIIRHNPDGYYLDVEEIAEKERPPMITLPEYQSRTQAERVTT